MSNKRKQVEEYIYKYMTMMDPSGKNAKRYKLFFSKLSDKEFDNYMLNIRAKNDSLVFYTANVTDKVTVLDLVETAKKIGVKLFERIQMWDSVTKSYYLTPNEYMVIQVPIRRMSQFVDHKLSVPEGDSRIDMLTGQVAKPDKAGSISQIEIQTLYARGLEKTITELVKYRGGDVVAFAEMKRSLEENGTANTPAETSSVARSSVILDVLLSGMHIDSNASGV